MERKAQRQSLGTFKKQSINEIFLGIDFGTSFTKVSYSYAPTNNPEIQTIEWDYKEFLKPSIVYLQNHELYFEKPEGNEKEIKYFKYSIIEESLREKNLENTTNNFEKLCCVFFLANIIKNSLQHIKERLKITDEADLKIYVNMGVPLENFYTDSEKKWCQ